VSRTLPLAASRTSIRSERPFASQSSRYSATGWVCPSVRLMSTVKLLPYQAAATRSPALPGCWSARVSPVEAVHV
jgi:hypothetical protein